MPSVSPKSIAENGAASESRGGSAQSHASIWPCEKAWEGVRRDPFRWLDQVFTNVGGVLFGSETIAANVTGLALWALLAYVIWRLKRRYRGG